MTHSVADWNTQHLSKGKQVMALLKLAKTWENML